jgi:hypothetical protein
MYIITSILHEKKVTKKIKKLFHDENQLAFYIFTVCLLILFFNILYCLEEIEFV